VINATVNVSIKVMGDDGAVTGPVHHSTDIKVPAYLDLTFYIAGICGLLVGVIESGHAMFDPEVDHAIAEIRSVCESGESGKVSAEAARRMAQAAAEAGRDIVH
jgi:hypothetical protein